MADLIITIDGPAASGKSTVAKLLAEKLGASFLDTGAMYRAVTLAAIEAKVDIRNEEKLLEIIQTTDFQFSVRQGQMAVYIDGVDVTEQIRQPLVTASARHIASKASLREKLVDKQRQFAAGQKKIVTEGRDQGTVAFPDADIKFYLIADLLERAKRRQAELRAKGLDVNLEQIQWTIEERDKSDENRSVGPLKPAPDAIVIDTTDLSVEQVVEKILRCVENRRQKTEDRSQNSEVRRRKTECLSSVICHLISVAWYWLARWACRVFCILFFRIRIYGKENVPEEGAFILATNHQSYLDPVLCGVALKQHLCFLARDSLYRNKFFALLIYSLNAVPVKRDSADVSSMKKVISKLNEGRGVCLYPEATRTSNGRIKPFKPGFGLLCRRGQAVVVPVLIDGAFECWPRHKKIFSPGPVSVYYGKAISFEQIQYMGDEKLAELLTSTLRQMQNDCRIRKGHEPFNY